MTPLGIIAGGGRLPVQLAEACKSTGRPFFVLTFEGTPDLMPLDDVPHAVVRLGAVGEGFAKLRQAGVSEIVLAGKIQRPSLASLKPDATAVRLLSRIGLKIFSGDDALLKTVISFLEDEKFKVVGSEEVLKQLLVSEGVLGKVSPDAQAMADIAEGAKAAKALGMIDIGQAAIVENGVLLGTEGVAGTDALIDDCAARKKIPGAGVLVKVKKPAQDSRADLPAIGLQTVENIHKAGFAGIAIEAGGSIILDRELVIARADALGVFVVGIVCG